MANGEGAELFADTFLPVCGCGLNVWDHPFESDHVFTAYPRSQPVLIGLS